jgi:UDP-N-acetylmuramoylalanine--D-glutamate ligase
MIYEILKTEGKRHILLGGNIRGVSTLALLPEVEPRDIAVLELDSWQLQGFGDLQISPQIAVFTNLLSDHQNYYPNMDAYFADKANIFNYQKEGDTLICGKSIEERIKAARPKVAPHVPAPLPADWVLKIPGEHNRENASFAAEVLRALGLSKDEIRAGLESFEAVEGRLQFVREINGIKIYNDNNATTPDATIAALKALDPNVGLTKSRIILIMGGADKGLDVENLTSEVRPRCKKVVLLAGTGTDHVKNEFPDAPVCDSIEKAFDVALSSAQVGDIILFSPAFASFGMFKNEYDRGDQFMKLVKEL